MVALTTQEVVEEVSALSGDQIKFLRGEAKGNLYTLSKGILGYKDINPGTHASFCRFFDEEKKRRRLGLMPRTHLKTTIAGVADSIKVVLNDPDEARVLIAGETSTTAEKILSEIQGHWQKTELLRLLFPELVPPRFAGPGVKWSNTIASINRKRDYKEGSWNTIGVGGASVGSHFSRIKCDDLIGLEAMRSPAAMAAAIAWVSNIDSLLIDQHTDIIDFIGTRWSRRDLYNFVMELYGDRMAVFLREAIENGEIIFPQKHTIEEYQTMQLKTPQIWFSQYCNNPLAAGKNDFPEDGIQLCYYNTDGNIVLLKPDGSKVTWKIEDLDRVTAADPNAGDLQSPDTAAIVTTGVTPDDDIVVLESWSGRISPSDFVDKIFTSWKRWRPRVVGIEKAGQQSTEHYFNKKLEEEEIYIRVIPLKPANRNKIDRIRMATEPLIRSKKVYMLLTQTILRKAVAEFPDTHPIDELDCFAYGTEEGMWRTPYRQSDVDENEKVLKFIMKNRRNKRTGY